MQLPDNVQEICPEVTGDKTWYFQKDINTYFKVYNSNKEVYAKITGHNLPNPFELESNRLKVRKKLLDAKKDVSNFRIRCTKVTHRLWEHWNNTIKGGVHGNVNT